ncbi:hypothetical protein [Clostridium frigidicarnis]|uniref:Uncharacterized protein n=1 Tax=Clostridium frigidicarnis TaxID=84698 RepID=A0A1I0VXZ4_9CLOT|nr:hypothetical protein [Clostridium frigidicarnis]SFA81144.1 hypothetical protein SAMN04488528_1003110 [Clostridium frigidicarnis]
MEKEILQLLQNMNDNINDLKKDVSGMKLDISDLKSDVTNFKKDQDRIEVELDSEFDKNDEFKQFRIEMNKKLIV